MSNPAIARDALRKPDKGSHWLAGRTRRKAAVQSEDAAKALVRKRDRMCRWPFCANCKAHQPRLEVAHLTAKGAGGANEPSNMMLLDWLTHQGGTSSLEQHGRRIDPLTDAGTDGPCQFWAKDGNDQWYLVAEEVSIGIYRRD